MYKAISISWIVFAIILVGCGSDGGSQSVPASSLPVVVTRDSGDSDKIGRDFQVSTSCKNGRLDYSGRQLDSRVASSWVNFRIYDVKISDYSVETSGTHDLIPTGNGSTRVSLDPGTYYVEVENWNSDWEFSITCR